MPVMIFRSRCSLSHRTAFARYSLSLPTAPIRRGPDRAASRPAGPALQQRRGDRVDQVRPWFGEGAPQLADELLGGCRAAGRHAHAPGERDEVDRWARQAEHVVGLGSAVARADPLQLEPEDRVSAVVEDDRRYVEPLA